MNLDDIIIDRTPLEKAIRVESLRMELFDLGYTIVSTEWLHRELVAKKIRERKWEDA